MREFLIVGAGRFGSAVAETLYDKGHDVVVVDMNEEAVARIMNHVTHAAILDATDEVALKKLGVGNFDHVVIAIGSSLEASILATVLAKSAGAKHVISKANSQLSAKVLASVGADEVIRPEHDMGVRLAQQLIAPSIMDSFHLGSHHSVVEIEIGDSLSGRLADLKLPHKFGVQIIAVNQGNKLEVSPGADFQILQGDRIVVIGSNENIEKFRMFITD
ncbi:MAG: TrkA family potassium uptake protein [Trueperaceae bacterium]|nr:TrkA family potassium uptake protein [Trueperaceae bacterium]